MVGYTLRCLVMLGKASTGRDHYRGLVVGERACSGLPETIRYPSQSADRPFAPRLDPGWQFLPNIPEVHDPYQRTFTEDEQKALVDAAFEGVSEMNDKLTERAGDYSAGELADIQADMDAAVKVLHRADDN